jgi:hypothetical protein
MRFIRDRVTSAHLIALLALFVALGGSAYAFHLGKNAVKTKNIKNSAVTEAKLAPGSVSGSKIADGAVSASKLAAAGVGSGNLARIEVIFESESLPDGSTHSPVATCPPGERLIGGSGDVGATNSPDIVVTGTRPASSSGNAVGTGDSADAWEAIGNNYPGGNTSTSYVAAYALCLK